MLKNAAWLTIIMYVLSFVVFLVMLAPAAALVWFLPNGWSAGGFVFALIFRLGGEGRADRAVRDRRDDGGLFPGRSTARPPIRPGTSGSAR